MAEQREGGTEIDMVLVTRTVTVQTWIDRSAYTYPGGHPKDGQVMSNEDIISYEKSLSGEDAWQATVESVEVSKSENIVHSCSVQFKRAPSSISDV